jgi:hypothetical protein
MYNFIIFCILFVWKLCLLIEPNYSEAVLIEKRGVWDPMGPDLTSYSRRRKPAFRLKGDECFPNVLKN